MTLLIADDHPIIRVSLKYHIPQFLPEANVLLCETFPEVLTTLDQQAVDVVVLDIDIPGSENTRMMKLIREKQANVLILIYSGLDKTVYALPYLQTGADGFLSKTASYSDFEVAITALLRQGKYFSADIQQLWLSKLGEQQKSLPDNPLQTLSEQEKKIAQLMTEGKWTKEIAAILKLKGNTISTYKKRIFEKLDVSNIMELTQKVNIFKHL